MRCRGGREREVEGQGRERGRKGEKERERETHLSIPTGCPFSSHVSSSP